MSQNRYYSKKGYKGDYSAFGVALVFAIIGTVSLLLRYTFKPYDFWGISTWGYWLFIPAFFIFVGAIDHLARDRRMKNAVFASVQNRTGAIKLENLAMELGINPQDVLRILVALRVSHGLQYRYDGATGDIVFGEEVQYKKDADFVAPVSKKQAEAIYSSGDISYCPYCGQKALPNAQFCENCGSKLS
jgi:hypothetical protein